MAAVRQKELLVVLAYQEAEWLHMDEVDTKGLDLPEESHNAAGTSIMDPDSRQPVWEVSLDDPHARLKQVMEESFIVFIFSSVITHFFEESFIVFMFQFSLAFKRTECHINICCHFLVIRTRKYRNRDVTGGGDCNFCDTA